MAGDEKNPITGADSGSPNGRRQDPIRIGCSLDTNRIHRPEARCPRRHRAVPAMERLRGVDGEIAALSEAQTKRISCEGDTANRKVVACIPQVAPDPCFGFAGSVKNDHNMALFEKTCRVESIIFHRNERQHWRPGVPSVVPCLRRDAGRTDSGAGSILPRAPRRSAGRKHAARQWTPQVNDLRWGVLGAPAT